MCTENDMIDIKPRVVRMAGAASCPTQCVDPDKKVSATPTRNHISENHRINK